MNVINQPRYACTIIIGEHPYADMSMPVVPNAGDVLKLDGVSAPVTVTHREFDMAAGRTTFKVFCTPPMPERKYAKPAPFDNYLNSIPLKYKCIIADISVTPASQIAIVHSDKPPYGEKFIELHGKSYKVMQILEQEPSVFIIGVVAI